MAQIRSGQNATTTYVGNFRQVFPATLNALAKIVRSTGSGQTGYSEFKGTPDSSWGDLLYDPSGLATTEADIIAREQFVSRYRERRTQFQSGVFLGELMKTVQMISSPAKALRKGIDAYHHTVKKRLRNAKKPNRVVRDTWLEFVYGWGPLINDVKDACQLGTADPYKVFQSIKGKGTVDGITSNSRQDYANSFLNVDYRMVMSQKVTVKYKGAIAAQNEPPGFPEQLGLSWSNVLPTVWELIPYSFLVDYFTNVGKVIDGIATGPISLAWGCQVIWKEYGLSVEGVQLDRAYLDTFKPDPKDKAFGFATGGGKSGRRVYYFRQPANVVSLGLRDFRFKLPGSNIRWLNIAALARLRS
jgi:hypothetical protein